MVMMMITIILLNSDRYNSNKSQPELSLFARAQSTTAIDQCQC
jgi:hypothetical protein